MRILVDESVPAQMTAVLRALLPEHEVQSVQDIKWSGRDDATLLSVAAERGFHAFLTRTTGASSGPDTDLDPDPVTAHGLHHIRFTQQRPGRTGLALAMSAVIATITTITETLTRCDTPRHIHIPADLRGSCLPTAGPVDGGD